MLAMQSRSFAISPLLLGRCGASTSRIWVKPRLFRPITSIRSRTGSTPAESQTMSISRSRQEAGEMPEAHALETRRPVEPRERTGILRADPVHQNLVQLAHLARADDREAEHVPERKAQVIDQHLAARIRMPRVGAHRRQELVEIARRRVEIDLGRKLVHQLVQVGFMALDEPAGKEVEALDLAGGRSFREYPRHLLASLGAVESRVGTPAQRVQPRIKFPLQAIDDQRIQSLEARLVEQLVEAVLSLDQEMQAPFAVAEVEREQKLGPAREIVDRYLRCCAVADCEQEFGPAREILERSLARGGVVH